MCPWGHSPVSAHPGAIPSCWGTGGDGDGDGFGHAELSGAAKTHTKTRSIREVLDGVVLPGGCWLSLSEIFILDFSL